MNHWELWRYRLSQLGAIGNLGLALMAVSLLWLVFVTLPLYFKASELVAISTPSKPAVTPAGDASAPSASGEATSKATPAKTMDAALARLFSAARSNGVRIDRGEYSVAASSSDAARQFAINIPVQGSYNAVRGFLSAALNDNPGLMLEQLRVSRPSAEDGELSASLKFTLTLGGAR